MAHIQVDNITKSYNSRRVVDGISLEVKSGEIVGLLGPNGAGKTSTFYIILGLIEAEGGKVSIDDIDITGLPMFKRARLGINYLPQESSVFRKLTVKENILAVLEVMDISRNEREEKLQGLLKSMGLSGLMNSKAYSLSGGERRRVEIARALATQPQFMLLDEPFSEIDPIAISELQKTIKLLADSNIGILITDHNVRDTLKITDRAYIINNGKIFASGTPLELANNEEVKKIYLGKDFQLY
ncbi:MAG: LPS export ABC transporter ATP-binding protein [Candidatus Fischerbacteria bacterium RBG_13_37_8]|uniref:LPS export ABC transporter ATP-binding protein n=1 Tax=Candidatus Fischerbacteria bacterium RBG_13_37_8 TaxID=1817863 RepID=A0A1F5VRV0_9BACT|nr:MAG: LPS export ABC transporter ATP-binding protein [Candidatus Fischerbacteria bacterium RBG_13_37_8]